MHCLLCNVVVKRDIHFFRKTICKKKKKNTKSEDVWVAQRCVVTQIEESRIKFTFHVPLLSVSVSQVTGVHCVVPVECGFVGFSCGNCTFMSVLSQCLTYQEEKHSWD